MKFVFKYRASIALEPRAKDNEGLTSSSMPYSSSQNVDLLGKTEGGSTGLYLKDMKGIGSTALFDNYISYDETSLSDNNKLKATYKYAIIKYNPYRSYCNNAVVNVKVGDSISLYPDPDNFFSTKLDGQPIFTVTSITKEKVVLEITNKKKNMSISNGETELGKLVLNELEGTTAEMTINTGIGYYESTDNNETISQQLFLSDIVEEEEDNV